MGVHKNIDHGKFPKQSNWVGQVVDVIYHYDSSKKDKGVIVRDDMESPMETLIKVGDNILRATECQHGIPEKITERKPKNNDQD